MTEKEFLDRWEEEKSLYATWGSYVIENILNGIDMGNKPSFNALNLPNEVCQKILGEWSGDPFEIVRIQPKARLKDDISLLQKAFYRGKGYDDPYKSITDKVGVRFIVLHEEQIGEIEPIIEICPMWDCSKDFDYRNRSIQNRENGYQSVHYIVTSNKNIPHRGNIVPPGISCEIQIRTLLQHVYSEVSHDTFYKNSLVKETPESKEAMLRVVRLIEDSDREFRSVLNSYDRLRADAKYFHTQTLFEYWQEIGINELASCPVNDTLLGSFGAYLSDGWLQNLRSFYSVRQGLKDRIRLRTEDFLLFRQPMILPVYYLAFCDRGLVKSHWPFEEKYLQMIFDDLEPERCSS